MIVISELSASRMLIKGSSVSSLTSVSAAVLASAPSLDMFSALFVCPSEIFWNAAADRKTTDPIMTVH